VAGWYGKMPCLGDFASRRLAPDFVQPWDAWLQRSIAASRHELGETWLDTFLTSPIWRFALTAGVCGAHAWIGVLVPSVDRVGRYFPLTLALALERETALVRAMRAQSWFAELEAVALAALNTDFSIDALERSLSDHPFLETAVDEGSVSRELIAVTRDAAVPRVFQLPDVEVLPGAIEAAAHRLLDDSAAGLTFWWCVAPETRGSELHVSVGLPPPEHFGALLQSPARTPAVTASTNVPEASKPLDPLSLEALALDPQHSDPLADTMPLDPLKALDSSGSR
jgi:type VI secretion system protein ImpM